MSWQSYVDTNLVGTGNVTSAAIVGLKGGVWASSAGFTVSGRACASNPSCWHRVPSSHGQTTDAIEVWQLSPQEITNLVKGFDDPSPLQAGGIHVNGKKYFALQANPRSIYGKQSVRGIPRREWGRAP